MQSPDNSPHNFSNNFGRMPAYRPAQAFNQTPCLPWKPRIIALLISLSTYVLACALPVLDFSKSDGIRNPDGPIVGVVALIMGWVAIAVGQFAWLANFLWLFSLLLIWFRCWIAAAVTSISTILLALQTYALLSQKIPANGAATDHLYFQGIKIGFYFWLASFVAIGISAIILRQRERALVQASQYRQPPYPQL
jgi:hypothetical protein